MAILGDVVAEWRKFAENRKTIVSEQRSLIAKKWRDRSIMPGHGGLFHFGHARNGTRSIADGIPQSRIPHCACC